MIVLDLIRSGLIYATGGSPQKNIENSTPYRYSSIFKPTAAPIDNPTTMTFFPCDLISSNTSATVCATMAWLSCFRNFSSSSSLLDCSCTYPNKLGMMIDTQLLESACRMMRKQLESPRCSCRPSITKGDASLTWTQDRYLSLMQCNLDQKFFSPSSSSIIIITPKPTQKQRI